MAAGAEAVSSEGRSGSSSGSSAVLEATLDRRFQGVTNTMESIQNLSTWCIENKKQHALVVRYWMKWLRKSETSHRLNLFYLANDVIQNCKRRNAIAYRSSFAEVLPEAALLVKDGKVRKSVERIFNIWKERNVYPDELISELKANLQKKETPPPAAPANPKAILKSKIVAEFAPQAFAERLVAYKRSTEESDLREKQLSALRVDVCSTEALKRLKDKAGGNKFSKDFEEGSLKLQEFVRFLEGQMKVGPPLLEALGNADVFYEMQYKEVKIVANAYQTFANRVSNLKRKLDALKATLPDLDESPVPSPLEDAPSPSGSESSSHELGRRPKDDRDSEDMEMSEDEPGDSSAGAEEKEEKIAVVSKLNSLTVTKSPTLTTPTKAASELTANQAVSSTTVTTPTSPLSSTPLNLANVDLGKISSILSSITNAMKNSGVSSSPVSRPSPGTPNTPSSHTPVTKAPPISAPAAPNPLASILSKVDISPEGILNALTKTNTHGGLSSLLSSARAGSLAAPNSAPSTSTVTTATTTPTTTVSTTQKAAKASEGNGASRDAEREKEKEKEKEKEREKDKEREKERQQEKEKEKERERQQERERQREKEREKERQREKEREKEREHQKEKAREKEKLCERQEEETVMPSLESKINSFLQGNPGFAGVFDTESSSPLIVGGDSTPVRDERGGTPTQDEMIDSPRAVRSHHKSDGSSWGTESSNNNKKDRDYRVKSKEPDVTKRRGEPSSDHAPFPGKEVTSKAKSEARRASTGREKGKEEKAARKKEKVVSGDKEGYRRIETVVTAATGDGAAPIETLGYSNRIQTVESIRVIDRSSRRSSGASWYEEAEFMEAPPQPHHGNHASGSTGDLATPPSQLLPQYPTPTPPPPPLPFFPSQALLPPMVTPPHVAPPTPPPVLPASFPPSPTTSTVMVGGILVPIDRVLPLPPPNHRPDTMGVATTSTPSSVNSHSVHPFHRPLLGQNQTPPSPTTPTTPTTPASRDARPLLPSPPSPLLHLPSTTQRLPLPFPSSREPLLRGTKRSGSAYRGGLLRPPKRPYLPPRY